MRFFDAHCDTVMHAYDGDFDFRGRRPAGAPGSAAIGGRRLRRAALRGLRGRAAIFPETDLRALAEKAVMTIHGWADAAPHRLQVVTGA